MPADPVVSHPTIFVAIPSYCDRELPRTVRYVYQHAKHPDRVHVAILDQCRPEDAMTELLAFGRHITYLPIPYQQAKGVGFARALAMQAYRGQDIYLQLDAHTYATPHWDVWVESLIASAPHARCAWTAYPLAYRVIEEQVVVDMGASGSVIAAALAPTSVFRDDPTDWTLLPQGHTVVTNRAIPATNLAAGFLCAPGAMVEAIPYDPQLYFYGEEQAMMARLYTHGWDVWHPVDVPFYHLYNNATQDVRPVHWRAADDQLRPVRWWEYEAHSKQRLHHLLTRQLHGIYGLGTVRDLADFAEFSGIDYLHRRLHPQAFTVRV